jgi:Flp pilus assembly pilin Flp
VKPVVSSRHGSVLGRLAGDRTGSAIIEFALIAPVLLILMIGTIEVALVVFVGSSIESAVLQASRFGITNAEIEGTRADHVRDLVRERTFGFVDMDEAEIETLVYSDFSSVGKPEPFTDTNHNGVYNAGEAFTDVNGNARWDADMGAAGLGGAGDIVLYRVSYEWGILTPLVRSLMGQSIRQVASVAVRNEDF